MSLQLVLLTYILFYGTGALILYATLTFDITLITILILIAVIQIPIGRWEWFTNLVKNYMHPSGFFQQFNFINDTD